MIPTAHTSHITRMLSSLGEPARATPLALVGTPKLQTKRLQKRAYNYSCTCTLAQHCSLQLASVGCTESPRPHHGVVQGVEVYTKQHSVQILQVELHKVHDVHIPVA